MNDTADTNAGANDTLFISDLHLSMARPKKVQLFLDFLQGLTEAGVPVLYILGDLFDAFLGDNDSREPVPTVFSALSEANRRGLTVFFISGNRELEMGTLSQARSGVARLPDPAEVGIDGEKLLLSHGDILCTDDHAYFRYRRFITHSAVLFLIRLLPMSFRHALANQHRKKDAVHYQNPVDVNAKTVSDVMRRHNASVLIHGHTHRQGVHESIVDNRKVRRFVLGDWYNDDCVLTLRHDQFHFYRVRDYLAAISRPVSANEN